MGLVNIWHIEMSQNMAETLQMTSQVHIIATKYLCFDHNFPEMCFQEPNLQ